MDNIILQMLLMNFFWRIVNRQNVLSLFLEPLSEALTVVNLRHVTSPAGYELAQNLTWEFIESRCAVVTTTPHHHKWKMYIYISIFLCIIHICTNDTGFKDKKKMFRSIIGWVYRVFWCKTGSSRELEKAPNE